MKKKPFFILIILVFLPAIHLIAQNTITLSYDNTGNIQGLAVSTPGMKSAVIETQQSINDNDSSSLKDAELLKKQDISYVDSISGQKVTIYPNPTVGFLNISISGVSGQITGSIDIYGIDSQMVTSVLIKEPTTNVDMHKYTSGIYILKILFNGNISEFKVLKN